MIKSLRIRLWVYFLLSPAPLLAQTGQLQAQVEAGFYGSTSGRTPFWLRTNRWGTAPIKTPAGQLRLGLHRAYKAVDSLHRRRLDWGFGVEGVGNVNQDADQFGRQRILLPEAYAKVRLGRFELWGGRRRQIIGLVDTVLSSGSYAVSANALPVPKVQIGIPDYLPIGFLGKAVAFKGLVAHGWFNVPYIQQVYLHQKSLFVRFGRPASPLHVQLGINHQVQWGGHANYLKNNPVAANGRLDTNLEDFFKSIVLGKIPDDWENDRFTSFDGANRVGNHVGSMDFGVDLTRPRASWLLYHQHPYEDASGITWRNAPDGLYGLRWQNRTGGRTEGQFWLWRRVVGELVYTKYQSGAAFTVPGQNFKGADNYYNHAQYIEGWSYFGQTLGTPFIIPGQAIIYPHQANAYYFPSNRLIAYYAAFDALVGGRASLQGRVSYSQNYGTYSAPYLTALHQFSGSLQVGLPVPKVKHTMLSATLALDQGQLLTNATGLYVGVRRNW